MNIASHDDDDELWAVAMLPPSVTTRPASPSTGPLLMAARPTTRTRRYALPNPLPCCRHTHPKSRLSSICSSIATTASSRTYPAYPGMRRCSYRDSCMAHLKADISATILVSAVQRGRRWNIGTGQRTGDRRLGRRGRGFVGAGYHAQRREQCQTHR